MAIFVKRGGGGRRADQRVAAPLLAQLTTVSKTFESVLLDLSATGARVQGKDLPAVNEDLWFSANSVRTVATVKWRREGECGVQFCEPLLQEQVIGIRREVANGARLAPEMRAALEDWVLGVAR